MRDAAVYTGRAAVRAGVLVTGTEVLSGIISDRNGPWLSEQLRDLGVDVAMIEIVGDRPADLLTALRQMRAAGLALVVTSGGLGPTAEDLTAQVVGEFSRSKPMVLDDALEERRSSRSTEAGLIRSAGRMPIRRRCGPPTASRL